MNGHPRPMPGPAGQQVTKEQLEGQMNSMKLRLSIVEERLRCFTALADALSGDKGESACNVLGDTVVRSVTALMGSYIMEAEIEQKILSQGVEQIAAAIRQISSNIVVPQFGVPRQ